MVKPLLRANPKGGILLTVRLKKNASAFHGVSCPFGGISSGDRYHAGLPPRHLPFTKFLTFSTVSSHLNLVGFFHPTSTHRIPFGLQSFPHSTSRGTSQFPAPLLPLCERKNRGLNALSPKTEHWPYDQNGLWYTTHHSSEKLPLHLHRILGCEEESAQATRKNNDASKKERSINRNAMVLGVRKCNRLQSFPPIECPFVHNVFYHVVKPMLS